MTGPATAAPKPGCRFCLANGLLLDSPLFTNGSFYFLPSIDPGVPLAGMIVPFRHAETPFDFDADEWRDLGDILGRARAHFAEHQPDGFTIGWNVGEAAGQHVPHAHLHVIPRFASEPHAGAGIRRALRQLWENPVRAADRSR